MPCTNNASTSVVVIPSSAGVGGKGLGFLRAIIDAFHETLDMRRAAYRKYSLTDE
jgi:hypothetical protein